MINKYELFGIFFCVGAMALVLMFIRVEDSAKLLGGLDGKNQVASTLQSSSDETLKKTIKDSMNMSGIIDKMIVNDVVVGTGSEVKKGDSVSVHYAGTLQTGEEFDNSKKRGEPFSFTVGEGRVIKGWDEGLIGMKVGGQRILVIPADMAYGANAVGPIPANSTLIFSIELVAIK